MNGEKSKAAENRVAACACGALRVTVSGAPASVNLCSCLACQRRTGSAFAYTAFFPDAQVVAIEGDTKSWRREGHSGGDHEAVFCPACGVTVFARLSVARGMIAVSAGCFADPDFDAPSRFFWTATRQHWLGPVRGAEYLERQ